MERYVFQVQGSAIEPYEVTIQRDRDNLIAYCTCPAGEVGQYCKHRFAILSGNVDKVVRGAENVSRAAALLPGTDVEDAWNLVLEAEARLEAAKRDLGGAKKKLAQSMSS